MSMEFYEAVKARRSVYALGKEEILSTEKLKSLLEEALRHAPTAFSTQHTRIMLLTGERHQRLWDLVWEALQETVPTENLARTKAKLDSSFASGYATILFFIDDESVKVMMEKNPLYARNFPVWAEQSAGILQYLVWTSLAAEGVGASLQHYNPLVDSRVAAEWQVPRRWRLISQMPVGSIAQAPPAKQFPDTAPMLRVE